MGKKTQNTTRMTRKKEKKKKKEKKGNTQNNNEQKKKGRKKTHRCFFVLCETTGFCDFTQSKRERKRKGETMRGGGGGGRRRRLSSVFVLFVFVFVFVVVFQDASSSFVEGAKWNNKKEEERILWLKKWEKPCVACVRDKGVWCDNGRDDRGCVTKPNFWNTLRCARTVKCKKGCTPVRDMLDAFCKHNNNLCEKYDRAKRALIGKKKK